MKIRAAIRAVFSEQEPVYLSLKKRVDELFQPTCRAQNWHYESRVKQEESFALKIETGITDDPATLEDFFACAIVVKNSTQIGDAVKIVQVECDIVRRRPTNPQRTRNQPATFEFDDLRLYVKLKKPPGATESADFERVFEVQVRTFLLHAWSIATHELTYKTDDVSWGKARIAYQVRAMLENAELSILSAEELAKTDVLDKEDRHTAELRQVIELVKTHWPADRLPKDLRRLAQNIHEILLALDVPRARLTELITAEVASASLPLDENAYQTSLRLLIKHEEPRVRAYVAKEQRRKLVLYEELSVPDWLRPPTAKNVIVVKQ